uniref:Uncharacterized protein n=1 Tax=Mycolicibacterium gilvum (strain PYR-GCK) TaxID=350054 RepID=A4T4L5_MYCGI|nr:hypothetical protein Mflv_0903 [Mycolicibacterium gilvum PYR-GCK]
MVKFAAAVHLERENAGQEPFRGLECVREWCADWCACAYLEEEFYVPSLRATILPRSGPITPRRRSAAMSSSGSLWAPAMPPAACTAAASDNWPNALAEKRVSLMPGTEPMSDQVSSPCVA